MKVVFQVRVGVHHYWRTFTDVLTLPCPPALVPVLRGEYNRCIDSGNMAHDDHWAAFHALAESGLLLDCGCMLFEDLFRKDIASISPIADMHDFMFLVPTAFPYCAEYGLDNVQIVFGFEPGEIVWDVTSTPESKSEL